MTPEYLYYIFSVIALRAVLSLQMLNLLVVLLYIMIKEKASPQRYLKFAFGSGRISVLEAQVYYVLALLIFFAVRLFLNKNQLQGHTPYLTIYVILSSILITMFFHTALFGAKRTFVRRDLSRSMKYNYSRESKQHAVEQMMDDLLEEAEEEALKHIRNKLGEDVPVDVVVRPEDIYFTTDPARTQFTATVKSCTFKGVHYEMFVDTDSGNELMIQDYDPYPVGSTVNLYIDPDDIQVMKKERLCNTLEGVWNGDSIDFDLPEFSLPVEEGLKVSVEGSKEKIPVSELSKGDRLRVEIPFGSVDLLDDIDGGLTSGEVHFILYKGDHYHLTIKTTDGGYFWVDTQDVWDKGDLVGVGIKKKGLKLEILDDGKAQ